MSVFGTSGNTRFEYNSTEQIIINNVITRFEPVIIERRIEDNLDGSIDIDHIGERYIFECKSYVGEEKQYIDEFNRLYQFNHKKVYCAPFSEGEYFQNLNGEKVLCLLKIKWGWLKTRKYYDILTFSFETLKVVDLSKMVLSNKVRVDPVSGMVRINPNTGKARVAP